jgi:hypothetical protein
MSLACGEHGQQVDGVGQVTDTDTPIGTRPFGRILMPRQTIWTRVSTRLFKSTQP